jgi:formate dehydrogenase maturation protein FdhE
MHRVFASPGAHEEGEEKAMIFYWLGKFLRWLLRMIQMPKPLDVARIHPNSRCPVCGASRGSLRAVEIAGGVEGKNLAMSLCQHTCSICGARWFEAAVVKIDPSLIQPALPRNENALRKLPFQPRS